MSSNNSDYRVGLEIASSFTTVDLALSISEIATCKHPATHRIAQHIRAYMENVVTNYCLYYTTTKRELVLENGSYEVEGILNSSNSNRVDEVLLELIHGEFNEIVDFLTKDDTQDIAIPKNYLDLARFVSKEYAMLAYLMDFHHRVDLIIPDIA